MAEFNVNCPHCNQELQCNENHVGVEFNCPACQQPIVIPQLPDDSPCKPPSLFSETEIWVMVGTASCFLIAFLVVSYGCYYHNWDELIWFILLLFAIGLIFGFMSLLSSRRQTRAQWAQNVLQDIHEERHTFPESRPHRVPQPSSWRTLPPAAVFGLFMLVIAVGKNWDSIAGWAKKSGGQALAPFNEVTTNGKLFVKLNSGEIVPLALVPVAVYDEQYLSNRVPAINASIEKGRASLSLETAKFDAWQRQEEQAEKQRAAFEKIQEKLAYWWKEYQDNPKNIEARNQWQAYLDAFNQAKANVDRDNANAGSSEYAKRDKINRIMGRSGVESPVENLKQQAKAMTYALVRGLSDSEPWHGAVASVQTDDKGQFSCKLPKAGGYVFCATAARQSLGGVEHYFFWRSVRLDKGGASYQVDLNNEYECVSQYTENWSQESRAERGSKIHMDVLYWIMKSYGVHEVK